MLKAAQTKWIARLVTKMSIQDALMQFDQQIRDAAMSFQVRRPLLFYCFYFSKTLGTKIDGERHQVSSLIEIHYAIGARGGASSSTPPQITDKDIVSSPIESSETLSSLSDVALKSSVSSFEVVKRSRGSAGSSLSSFTFIEADSEILEPESESLMSSATPVPTQEEEFLANMCGDTDEFGVSLPCIYPRFTPGLSKP
jgi:hypothetical protein